MNSLIFLDPQNKTHIYFINKFKDSLALDKNAIKQYNSLTKKEKKDFLSLLKDFEVDQFGVNYKSDEYIDLSLFLNKEFLIQDIKKVKDSKIYNSLLHALFYHSYTDMENMERKKEVIELYVKKEDFDINQKYNDIPFIHLAAVNHDKDFLEYLVSLGAKTDIVDSDNDSLASASLYFKENLSALEFALSQPNFNPNLGQNILAKALNDGYDDAIALMIKHNLIANKEFLDSAFHELTYSTAMDEIKSELIALHEKHILEQMINSGQSSKKIKI